MYRIKDAKFGGLIEESINVKFVKQQERVDFPILCDSLADADGVVLSDGNTMLGIEGRNMQNYKPTVNVEEVSGEPKLFGDIKGLENDLATTKEKLNALDQQTTALMLGMTDIFSAILEGGAK